MHRAPTPSCIIEGKGEQLYEVVRVSENFALHSLFSMFVVFVCTRVLINRVHMWLCMRVYELSDYVRLQAVAEI